MTDQEANVHYDRLTRMVMELRRGTSIVDVARRERLEERAARKLLVIFAWELDALRIDFLDDAEMLEWLQRDAELIASVCRIRETRVDVHPLYGRDLDRWRTDGILPLRYAKTLLPYARYYNMDVVRSMRELVGAPDTTGP